MIVGVTGGIGAGKTELSRYFNQLGAPVVDADVIAHRLLGDGSGRQALVDAFGAQIVDSDGQLDRRLLGRKALANRASLERLYAIIRPELERALRAELDRSVKNSPNDIVVFDAPLIYEWGIEDWVDCVVVVDAERSVRIERIRQRSGLDREEIERRMDLQMDSRSKRDRADFVIDNSGSVQELACRAAALWEQLETLQQQSRGDER